MTTSAAPSTMQKLGVQHKVEVLIVENNAADSGPLLAELQRGNFDASSYVVRNAEDFRMRIRQNLPDIILADCHLDGWLGMGALEILHRENRDIPLILVSGSLGDEAAVECIKQGASDYVLKDNLGRLSVAIYRALEEQGIRNEQKKAEQALDKKVEELARSNRDLEQFAYVASHDLQEPLRMVSAYTQLLADRYKGQLDEQADKYIHYAVDGATRMQELIHDLLLFSRAGRENTTLQNTDCNILVGHAVRDLQAAVAESGAAVKYKNLPTVMANGAQLEQVFHNLIGNAIKFRDGAIPDIEIGAEREGAAWIFSISDNGIGIAPEHAEAIFSIFQRLHARSEYSGNGIGLAICKRIVEQFGGEIWLGNHTGPGCTFNFSIPAMESGAVNLDDNNQRGVVGG